MTLRPEYFERLYAADPDPWGFEQRWYERRKYALTLAALPEPRYRSAFEPGCSVGVLTEALASRCDRLLASDAAPQAVTRARQRLAAHPHVTVERRVLPADWPVGTFDLVVLSELLYYFALTDLDRVLHLAAAAVAPGGTLLAVHWRHPVADYPLTGDTVHDRLAAVSRLPQVVSHREDDFALDVYLRPGLGQRPDALSVAARTGLV